MALGKTPWNKGIKQPVETLKAKQQAYYKANRERIIKRVGENRAEKSIQYKHYMKWYAIYKKYGVTEEAWKAMEVKQEGKCAVCRKKSVKVVDHCHDSGKVRGLLCHGCNRDMAIVDRPELLEAAKRYKYGT